MVCGVEGVDGGDDGGVVRGGPEDLGRSAGRAEVGLWGLCGEYGISGVGVLGDAGWARMLCM